MRLAQDKALTDRMPFLFRLIKAKLNVVHVEPSHEAKSLDNEELNLEDPNDNLEEFDGSFVKSSRDRSMRRANRGKAVRLVGHVGFVKLKV